MMQCVCYFIKLHTSLDFLALTHARAHIPQTQTHTQTHMQTHTNAHTHIYKFVYIHTQTRTQGVLR